MANVLDTQVLEEGPRNLVVKLTGVLDTSDISETAIDISAFTANNDVNGILSGFRVDLIEYSIGKGLEIQLAWMGNNPEQITPISGRGRIVATNYGGFIPDQTRNGYNGSISLVTTGYPAGSIQNFTVIMELIKLYTV